MMVNNAVGQPAVGKRVLSSVSWVRRDCSPGGPWAPRGPQSTICMVLRVSLGEALSAWHPKVWSPPPDYWHPPETDWGWNWGQRAVAKALWPGRLGLKALSLGRPVALWPGRSGLKVLCGAGGLSQSPRRAWLPRRPTFALYSSPDMMCSRRLLCTTWLAA